MTQPAITLNQLGELGALIDERVRERVAEALGAVQVEGDGWLDGVATIAEYLGVPVSRLNDPAYRKRTHIPMFKENGGRGWVAKKSELDAWQRGLAPGIERA